MLIWSFCLAGHINHSERVMRVITWNRSFRGLPNADEVKDDFDSEKNETHATVLDKLLAWEKKLYDEVKVSYNCTFADGLVGMMIPSVVIVSR